jgi:threonine dehydrogenase-like Zn-dependent dehydrogenase
MPGGSVARDEEAVRALWIVGRDRVELRSEPSRSAGPEEVLVRSRFGAISRGTEALVAAGRVPPGEHARMRCPHQSGEFPFPVKYGYACVGTVEQGPDALVGRTVFCLHPHQDRFVVSAAAVIPVPDTVPAPRAVLAANMETALNLIWDAGVGPGDRVCVVGAGVVGALVAYLAGRVPGVELTLIDIDPDRARLAAALGVSFAEPTGAPADCDVVVHASATEAGLATAIAAAGFEARIVEASWYGDRPVSVTLGGVFHSRRLSLVSSQVGAVALERRARWPHGRRLAKAIGMLADPRLDALISGETAFDDLAGTYVDILKAPGVLCRRIRY